MNQLSTISKTEIASQFNGITTDLAISDLQKYFTDINAPETKEQYLELKKGISDIRGLISSIEAKRKELKADSLEYGRKIDAEAKRIDAALRAIGNPLKQLKVDYDAEAERVKAEKTRIEKERVDTIKKSIDEINSIVAGNIQNNSEEIQSAIPSAVNLSTSKSFYEEFTDEAVITKERAIIELNTLLAKRLAHEKELAEIEENKKKQAEEDERLRKEREEIEAEKKKLAEQKAAQDAIDAEKEKKTEEAAINNGFKKPVPVISKENELPSININSVDADKLIDKLNESAPELTNLIKRSSGGPVSGIPHESDSQEIFIPGEKSVFISPPTDTVSLEEENEIVIGQMTGKRFSEMADNWLGHLLDDVCPEQLGSEEYEEWVGQTMIKYKETFQNQMIMFANEVVHGDRYEHQKG